jgi:hypothetical protein
MYERGKNQTTLMATGSAEGERVPRRAGHDIAAAECQRGLGQRFMIPSVAAVTRQNLPEQPKDSSTLEATPPSIAGVERSVLDAGDVVIHEVHLYRWSTRLRHAFEIGCARTQLRQPPRCAPSDVSDAPLADEVAEALHRRGSH